MLFSTASAIAVYKSTFKPCFNKLFFSFTSLILAKSPFTDSEITSTVIGSGLLFAHEISAPRDKISEIFANFFNIKNAS